MFLPTKILSLKDVDWDTREKYAFGWWGKTSYKMKKTYLRKLQENIPQSQSHEAYFWIRWEERSIIEHRVIVPETREKQHQEKFW
jgi:hypothetical protein